MACVGLMHTQSGESLRTKVVSASWGGAQHKSEAVQHSACFKIGQLARFIKVCKPSQGATLPSVDAWKCFWTENLGIRALLAQGGMPLGVLQSRPRVGKPQLNYEAVLSWIAPGTVKLLS